MKKQHEQKEEFCGACVGAGLAIAGAGASAGSTQMSKEKHKAWKKVMLWGGVATVIMAFIMIFMAYKSNCKSCKISKK